MNTTISGCQALHGCEKKNECLRYQHFQDHPLIGFHAYQSCKLSEFTKKRYLHFVEITPEVALDELVKRDKTITSHLLEYVSRFGLLKETNE